MTSLLDVGCSVGALLQRFAELRPDARLAGTDINTVSLERARQRLPGADIRMASAESLPFPDSSFDVVTCVEVMEHVPQKHRAAAFAEFNRVLRPGGRLVLTTPHAGVTAWLDANNLRFRFPRLYGRLIGRGRRDATYEALNADVVWHHHFSQGELLELAGPGWHRVAVEFGGLVVYPLADLLSWPFYRMGRSSHPVRNALERAAARDRARDYGHASYGILIVLERERA